MVFAEFVKSERVGSDGHDPKSLRNQPNPRRSPHWLGSIFHRNLSLFTAVYCAWSLVVADNMRDAKCPSADAGPHDVIAAAQQRTGSPVHPAAHGVHSMGNSLVESLFACDVGPGALNENLFTEAFAVSPDCAGFSLALVLPYRPKS